MKNLIKNTLKLVAAALIVASGQVQAYQTLTVPYGASGFPDVNTSGLPSPVHFGGNVSQIWKQISQGGYASCARGTYISSDIQVLYAKNIRIDAKAQFWMHAVILEGHQGVRSSDGTLLLYSPLPSGLRHEVFSHLGAPNHFIIYTGQELHDRFNYPLC